MSRSGSGTAGRRAATTDPRAAARFSARVRQKSLTAGKLSTASGSPAAKKAISAGSTRAIHAPFWAIRSSALASALSISIPLLPAYAHPVFNNRMSFLKRFAKWMSKMYPDVPVNMSEWTHMQGGRDKGMDFCARHGECYV